MYKIILYYPYPLREVASGSSVRPKKMLEAFREYTMENRIELIEIYGESKERKSMINKFKSTVNPSDVLFCYVENSTLPFWLTDSDHFPRTPLIEVSFFRYLNKHNIPLGVFYRDIYWKFDDYALTGYKRVIMKFIYKLEHKVLKKYFNHFFLPSMEMNKYAEFPLSKTTILPPAGNLIKKTTSDNSQHKLNVIYVGGVSERYGTKILLDAIKINYNQELNIKLHLVCRIEEFKIQREIFEPFLNEPWLEIYHVTGDELSKVYELADIGIIPIKKTKYNDFAIPVKLYEYMSYGLPVIATNCSAQRKIIENNKIGIVVNDNPKDIADGIACLFDVETMYFYKKNVSKALKESNLWVHRVKEIKNKLINES